MFTAAFRENLVCSTIAVRDSTNAGRQRTSPPAHSTVSNILIRQMGNLEVLRTATTKVNKRSVTPVSK
jgi:hypothetical protein